MPGFPVRPTRAAFGPVPVDRFPAPDTRKNLPAAIGDLMMWQISGGGVVAPLVWAVIVIDGGGNVSLGASGEAWDPDGAFLPAVSKPAPGVYRVEYAATYPDKDGVSQATNLSAAMPTHQTTSDRRTVAKVLGNKREIEIRSRDGAGVLGDEVLTSILVVAW